MTHSHVTDFHVTHFDVTDSHVTDSDARCSQTCLLASCTLLTDLSSCIMHVADRLVFLHHACLKPLHPQTQSPETFAALPLATLALSRACTHMHTHARTRTHMHRRAHAHARTCTHAHARTLKKLAQEAAQDARERLKTRLTPLTTFWQHRRRLLQRACRRRECVPPPKKPA